MNSIGLYQMFAAIVNSDCCSKHLLKSWYLHLLLSMSIK